MSEERGLTTDQLSNIIQVIQLGRKSGQLVVERGEGKTLESGELTFFCGQITQARWNHYSGQEALRQLNTWGACRFTFTPTPTDPGTTTGPLSLPSTRLTGDTVPLRASSHMQALPDTHFPRSTGALQALDLAIPQRTMAGDKALRLIDQAGFSRSHLRLFLLIDGKRTINELTRLAGKKHEDVYRLLLDLENTGLIYRDRR